ncbi:MAG: cadmium-translocating P-type ATPase [Lachnospiraceae bacterium]|nr:cadmium-translocating P-type ATPase [Lachnospiraceae bacterium]
MRKDIISIEEKVFEGRCFCHEILDEESGQEHCVNEKEARHGEHCHHEGEEHHHEHGHCHGHEEHGHHHDYCHEDRCCCGHDHGHVDEDEEKSLIVRLITGAVIFAGAFIISKTAAPEWISIALYVCAYLVLGYDVVLHALKNILRGRVFDEHFLMSVSTIGAFAIREYPEAVAVMLLYQLGEYLQDLAVDRSRRSISSLLDIRPDTANLLKNGEATEVPAESVNIGDEIIIKAGEKIPLDGVVIKGESMLDTRALTGESVPRRVSAGEKVASGCINESGTLFVRVEKSFEESTASKIIDMVENASARKAPAERFITKFAKVYTPIVVALAVLIAVVPPLLFDGEWMVWLHRAFVSLIISCPCALVISIPLTFFGGLGAASKKGVLIKGSNYLEALSSAGTVVFDKTGTLTKGVFEVTEVATANGFDKEEVLGAAAAAESFSNHPIAVSIREAFGGQTAKSQGHTEISGKGVKASVGGKTVLVGNEKLLAENSIKAEPGEKPGTQVLVSIDGQYAGSITISDEIKPGSRKAIEQLGTLGVNRVMMLTGDEESISKDVAGQLGIKEYHAGLLPEDKLNIVEKAESELAPGRTLAFVGDGINDAPVIARADIGIAMGDLGADAAIEAADVVVMTDEPGKIAQAVRLARETKKIVKQNIVFALGVKAALLVLGALGIANMWMAVFGDTGVALLAVLNAVRIMRK